MGFSGEMIGSQSADFPHTTRTHFLIFALENPIICYLDADSRCSIIYDVTWLCTLVMPVPRMSQLRTGLPVNIVLKADQPSGKLTTGCIADILTRGDHPRGIKVRLTTGQVGRVQNISAGASNSQPASLSGNAEASDATLSQNMSNVLHNQRPPQHGRRSKQMGEQQDYLPSDKANVGASLFDYIRDPRGSSSIGAMDKSSTSAESSKQEHLEQEFPTVDPALIAAILLDYPEVSDARPVLSSLSTG